ncbi:MAG: kynureninase [Pseudomonadota bacterium]
MKTAQFRHHFSIPRQADGQPKQYFCGNSLGLMPDSARQAVELELDRWSALGVDGHFNGDPAWLGYHRILDDVLATLTGAKPVEICAMGTLTTNLHLGMISFYRPEGRKRKILIEHGAFPSDRYAMVSQLALYGFDAEHDLIELTADESGLIDDERVVQAIEHHAEDLALVLWPGVQYSSGQRFDMARICRAARTAGVPIGLDLAHAIGNVPLALNAWAPDFAVWCSYKYLNGGPGAVAGLFVAERHADFKGPRLAGWWGHDESSRFMMGPDFEPAPGAEGWQISGAPILNLAALAGSLSLYREAGIASLQEASVDLTAHFIEQLKTCTAVQIVTPVEPERRGCQLSIRLHSGRSNGRRLFEQLGVNGVVGDWREPDLIRLAPTPMYNTLAEVEHVAALIESVAA